MRVLLLLLVSATTAAQTAPNAVAVGDAGDAQANGYYELAGTQNDRPRYTRSPNLPGAGLFAVAYDGTDWTICETDATMSTTCLYTQPSDADVPPTSGWMSTAGPDPAPTISYGGPPENTNVVGAGTPDVDGVYLEDGEANNRTRYARVNGSAYVEYDGADWTLCTLDMTMSPVCHYTSPDDGLLPPATGWITTALGTAPAPTLDFSPVPTTLIATGAGRDQANGFYDFLDYVDGRPRYDHSPNVAGGRYFVLEYDGADWTIASFRTDLSEDAQDYTNPDDGVLVPLTGWATDESPAPPPTFTSGSAPALLSVQGAGAEVNGFYGLDGETSDRPRYTVRNVVLEYDGTDWTICLYKEDLSLDNCPYQNGDDGFLPPEASWVQDFGPGPEPTISYGGPPSVLYLTGAGEREAVGEYAYGSLNSGFPIFEAGPWSVAYDDTVDLWQITETQPDLSVVVHYENSTDGVVPPETGWAEDMGASPAPLVVYDVPTTCPDEGVVVVSRRPPADRSGPCVVTSTNAGWRMLAPPASGLTVGDLLGINFVQGIGTERPGVEPNFYHEYTGDEKGTDGGYLAPAALTASLPPGRGFFWYFYDYDGTTYGGGTSQIEPLPAVVTVPRTGPTDDVVVSFRTQADGGVRVANDDGFFLLGNPFDVPFDIDGISAKVDGGPVALQATVQIWDPVFQTYVPLAPASGEATPADSPADDVVTWQGFWVEASSIPTAPPLAFTFDADFRTVNEAAQAVLRTVPPRRLVFSLDGVIDGVPVADRSAWVSFTDAASAAWDRFDATDLPSLASPWVQLSAVGPGRGGTAVRKAVESREAVPSEAIEVPLALAASGAGEFTVSWSGADALPLSWTATLLDGDTGARYDLREQTPVTVRTDGPTDNAARFTVRIEPSLVTATDEPPAAFDVGLVYPNPTRGDARAAVRTASPQAVTVSVYDALGRRIRYTHEPPLAADATVAIPLDGLPSGVYLVRIAGVEAAASRRVVVVR